MKKWQEIEKSRKKGKCYKCGVETCRKSVISCKPCSKIGIKNPQWKGDDVGYEALHEYIKFRFPKPDHCEFCFKVNKNLDLANISQKYNRDLSDWEWLCRSCHMKKDGRIRNITGGKPRPKPTDEERL